MPDTFYIIEDYVSWTVGAIFFWMIWILIEDDVTYDGLVVLVVASCCSHIYTCLVWFYATGVIG